MTGERRMALCLCDANDAIRRDLRLRSPDDRLSDRRSVSEEIVRGIFVEDIWVIPQERRGGVARALMAALAKECAAKDYRRIDLNVLDWNPARGFYERIGFRWIRNWLPYRLTGEALARLANS